MHKFPEDLQGVFGPTLKETVLNLAGKGLVGGAKDYLVWLRMFIHLAKEYSLPPPAADWSAELTEENIAKVVNEYVAANILIDTGKGFQEFYLPVDKLRFPDQAMRFCFVGHLMYSPLQFVRSRVESFLRAHGTDGEELIDISIGVIEAAENAIKYGNAGLISCQCAINGQKEFSIEMINSVEQIPIEVSISTGKFNEGFTLMRGIMAMNKLFDHFDIIRSEAANEVLFAARKKLGV